MFELHSATVSDIPKLRQLVGRKNSPWSYQLKVPERANLTYYIFDGPVAPVSILQLPLIENALKMNLSGLFGITLIYVQSIKEGSNIFMELLTYCRDHQLIKYSPHMRDARLPVAFLHSNLTAEKKIEILTDAANCELNVLIATSAAGAGINLPVIGFV